jgi:hypothetical protein
MNSLLRTGIPRLLPNVNLPVMGDGDFYSVYYSAGVLLEAEHIAVKLPAGTKRVVQVFRRVLGPSVKHPGIRGFVIHAPFSDCLCSTTLPQRLTAFGRIEDSSRMQPN